MQTAKPPCAVVHRSQKIEICRGKNNEGAVQAYDITPLAALRPQRDAKIHHV